MFCVLVPRAANGRPKLLSQYLHEEWGSERGFPGGPINAMAQTPDGYLWIGTQKGLVRFDGWNFQLFSQTPKSGNPLNPVLGLVADGEGNLWIRLQGPSLFRYRGGNFEDFTNVFDSPEVAVTQMCLAPDGRAIFATISNGTIAYNHGKFNRIAGAPNLSNFLVTSIVPGPNGTYWMGTRDVGLFRLVDGKISPELGASTGPQINTLLSDGRLLWIGTENGLFLWDGVHTKQIGAGSQFRRRQVLSLLKDSDASIWVGTDQGIYRLDPDSDFSPKAKNNEGREPVAAIFADREGNIWTGGTHNLRQLRNSVFMTYGPTDGLPKESNGPLHMDSEGRLWFAPIDGGLYWLKDDRAGVIREGGLDKDVVYSIAGDAGDLWVARQLGGLTHLQNVDGKWKAVAYTKAEGLAQNSVYTVRVTSDGAVWAGTLSAGLTRIKNGKFATLNKENGLISNTIVSILESRNGVMWFATPRGLSGFSNNRWLSYSSKDGLPSDDVNCLFEDSKGTLWIGTANGLAAYASGKIWTPSQPPDLLQESVLGVQEDANGFLWISTSNHVANVNRERLFSADFNSADIREFGIADGLRTTDGVKRDEAIASDNSGRIWFSLSRGLSVVDTNRLHVPSPPSVLRLEGISVDGNPLPAQASATIAPNPRRITFNYIGVSLSVPERVRFKYRLDNFDKAWSEPQATREANYTNLTSGSYVFRVIASNSDGLWNAAEVTVPFTIEPAFWSTWWFRFLSLLAIGSAIFAYVRYRIGSVARRLNVRFEERLAERTRIAQDLHDTLLQGLLSASMQLHLANDQLVADSPAKPLVTRVLQLMSHAIDEGRNAVRGLRTSKRSDLEQGLSQIRQEFPAQSEIGFRVIVEGTPKALRPIVSDEVYRVGREALSNAFRHSRASNIEVELEYASSYLRLLVRDNGHGIDPHVLQSGRDGHWGLSGMKERTERIGGKLRVLSNAGAGTEVELSVPGQIAFNLGPSVGWRGWLSKFSIRNFRRIKQRAKSEHTE